MRLQSKKLNQPLLPPIITVVFILSLIYWLYLACATQMQISWDALCYQELGRMIENQGWLAYFKTGPNREPVYPLLVAASMHLENLIGVAFVKIMAIFGVIILFLTQVLTYKILRLCNIRTGVCALVLSYLALSPALNNSAFSLYSEIATYPFILGIILASFYTWEAIKNNKKYQACLYSILLGVCLTLATLVKGIFECVAPVYLIILFSTVFLADKQAIAKKIALFTLSIIAAVSFFYVPIIGYKWLNSHYNGNFAITGRASWMIYGNTARRVEPLTLKKFAEALAYAPGEGVCDSIFGNEECSYWSFQKSDGLGMAKQEELKPQHLSPDKLNAFMLKSSAQKALQNPFQYVLLGTIEGLKMFFWESTKIGFVSYPHWLQRIYDIKILNNGLRFLAFLATLIAVISIWLQSFVSQKSSPIGFLMGTLIFIYIFFFSFVCNLTRYALPIVPLYLIAIGVWINQNLTPKKIN